MIETRITRLETAVFGWTETDTGLMGSKGKHDKRLDALEASLLQVRTVVRAARWLILLSAALMTIVGSDHLARWLVTGLRAAATAIKG